jgi:hypothetical protein
MKDNLKLIVFVVLIMAMAFSLLAQNTKRIIAVLDLDPMGISPAESQFLSNRLRTELFETGAFQVVEREKMQEILNEQGFQSTGCTSVECAVEIGQLLNVKEMVAGSIGKIEDVYSITLRIIKVETGAIVKTATQDYEGKLSEVLTEVIPAVAEELATYQEEAQARIETEPGKEPVQEKSKFSRVALFLKGGISFLQYTGNINKIIDDFNGLYPALSYEHLANHGNFGLEGQYYMSEKLVLKVGIIKETILSPLSYTKGPYESIDEAHYFEKLEFERDFAFTNFYIGVNYNLVYSPQQLVIYLGADFGNTIYDARLIERYVKDGESFNYDNTYNYSAFTFKLAAGIEYYLSSSFSMSLEMILQSIALYNTSAEISEFEYFPTEFEKIIYPEDVNASGVLLNLGLGYHF